MNPCLAAALALSDAGYRVFPVEGWRKPNRRALVAEHLIKQWEWSPWFLPAVFLKNDSVVVCWPSPTGWRTEIHPPRAIFRRERPPPVDWPRLWRDAATVERVLAAVPCPKPEEDES